MARFKWQHSNLATGGIKPRNTSVKTAPVQGLWPHEYKQENYQFGHMFHQNLVLVGLWEREK